MKNRNRLLFTLLVIGFIALGSCRKQPSGSQQNANNNAPTAAQDAPIGGAAQTGDKFYFRGTIAGNLTIEMALVRDGDRLTGSYFYPKVGKNIELKGTIDKSGNVELKESDESGKDTGVFKGKWKPSADSAELDLSDIEGKWSKPDGSKETAFLVLQQPIEFTATARVAPKVIKEANKQARYTIDAEYPQIDGDTRFDKFNKEARGLITKDVAAFKSGESVQETDPGSETPAETLDSTLGVGYDFRLATDDLISVEFTEGQYERGAAHPNSFTTVLNYDVKNGKKLALADLFNAKANYLSVISSYCISDLRRQSKKDKEGMLDEEMMKSGASARADNYKAWAITKKGLWITFDPYQVAAYAAGPQHVLVPYSAMKDIIRSDGPVALFAK
ncbi:MAG TPA: RsiV family protein [Pyrinomonadaceae bacterium]|nr:RsiV family protein [Pyrinomonadaceae bacterium]